MLEVFINGFLIGGGLIVAIGLQNAFVLRQALMKSHVLVVCMICIISDAIAMSIGVFGIGVLAQTNTTLNIVLSSLGALFLLVYGAISLRKAWIGDKSLIIEKEKSNNSLIRIILLTLTITWLNPHFYIDTILLLGGIASSIPSSAKIYFLAGAVFASTVWFFTLGYGVGAIRGLFTKNITWRILDLSIGIIMWWITWHLIQFTITLV